MKQVLVATALAVCAVTKAQTVGVYYDSVQDGRLVGGRIEIDLQHPQHRQEYGVAGPLMRAGAWPVTTIRDHGPPSNRVDLVLIGDGYTSINLTSFATHANNVLLPFFAEEPFAAYATYFNVHRVDVLSNESGVDQLDLKIFKDTALDMAYGCFGVDRALCINVSKALDAAASAPEADQILALANSTRFGGAGYASADLGTVAGNSQSAVEIALHEFGHAFAGLADEYDYGAAGAYPGADPTQPNVTIYDATVLLQTHWKWFEWLDLPHVDTFEGAAYYEEGIFRPTDNSKMRSLGRPFEEVNVQQLVMSIYELVSPVDDATPAGTHFGCEPLFVTPLEPADHDLTVQWFVDGVAVAGANAPVFVPAEVLPLGGAYTVGVEVIDETPRVRDEAFRSNWMRFGRSWRIESNIPAGDCRCSSACADIYADGSIDLRDVGGFLSCFGGKSLASAGCVCADLNGDLEVNAADFAALVKRLGKAPVFRYPDCD